MKFTLCFAIALFATVGIAAHNVTVNIDGQSYICSPNGSGGGIADPNCVKAVTDYCDSSTSLGSSGCFTRASTACKGAPAGFIGCVKDTTEYCDSKTSIGKSNCFERSLTACHRS